LSRAEPRLSIVIPIRNERDNLQPLTDELRAVIGNYPGGVEVLLVDDASDDGSAETIAELARRHAEIRPLTLTRHSGQTAAFDAGFKAARGRVVVTMDGDLQNDPRDIPRLIEMLESHDVAVGCRRERHDPWRKRVASRVANAVRNRLTRESIVDTGCSLKAFRREALRDLKLYEGMHRFLPTLLAMDGFRVVQVPVSHRPRVAGRSKYGLGRRAVTGFADLLAVRWMKRRKLRYELDPEDS
jgi:glycosyltransferase involved in cell wall biosynthesis